MLMLIVNQSQPKPYILSNQIPPKFLLSFNRLKQTLKVTSPKPIKVIPLNNLNENSRPIHQVLREQLQKVPALVKINQDIQTLQHFKVLIELEPRLLKSHLHTIVIRLRHLDELNTSCFQIRNVAYDVVGAQGNVLDAWSAVEVDVFFDLRLLFALGRLVDGHLDDVVG